MTFKADYSEIGQKKQKFDLELKKQHADSCIHGPLHTIFIAQSEPPEWQLAYPVKKLYAVKAPLSCIEFISPVISVRRVNESQIVTALSRLELQIKELRVYRAFHTIIRYDNHHSGYDPFVEIIIPIQGKKSRESVIYQFTHNLIILAAILYFLSAILLVIFKPARSHFLFAIFLIAVAMTKWDWLLSGFNYTIFETFPHIFYLGEPFVFLVAPSLFLTAVSMTRKDFRFKAVYYIHLIPFILLFVLLFLRFYQYPAAVKQELILSRRFFSPMEQRIGLITLHLQMLGYAAACFFVIRRYQKEIPYYQASVRSGQINWFYAVLSGIVVIHYSGLIKHALFRFAGVFSGSFHVLSIITTMALIVIVLYQLVRHPRYFSIVDTNLAQKTKRYSLSDRSFETYKDRLLKYIRQDKPYLDPDLTLQKLSEQVSIPPHSLSEVINRGFNQNFFEFINTYRISEAKHLLAKSGPGKNILEIAYEVGYNNKSVFNAVFKKYTRKTPTEYRLQMIE